MTFTASNGIPITTKVSGDGRSYLLGMTDAVTHATASEEGIDALREFFQHEKDDEFGRWRRGHFVVYPQRSTPESVFVFDEATGLDDEFRAEWLRGQPTDDPTLREEERTALLYLLSRPEPKPWRDAKAGEVWVIQVDGGEEFAALVETFCDTHVFQKPDAESITTTRPDITAARRIWPEGAQP